MTGPLVLGIESSCDETGVGIVRGREVLANVIASSVEEQARFGGVVPEIAARAHLEAIRPTLERALEVAGVRIADLDAIAVTAGPGLAGALMVGVGAAKALAVTARKPLYGVNHLVGHVTADQLHGAGEEPRPVELPTVALLVSGGHTSLLLVRDLVDDVELLGETLDDAAGEAFDKTARLLGLPYPGGPSIDRAALDGDPRAIRFPRGLTAAKDRERHRFDFSFSGLKTAVARHVERAEAEGAPMAVGDVAASFREAVVDVLVAKALDACAADRRAPRCCSAAAWWRTGGSARSRRERAAAAGVRLRIPPFDLCTDNGAMIAGPRRAARRRRGRTERRRLRGRLEPAGRAGPDRLTVSGASVDGRRSRAGSMAPPPSMRSHERLPAQPAAVHALHGVAALRCRRPTSSRSSR